MKYLTGSACKVHGVEVSTQHFTGNYPPRVSIRGANLPYDLPARKGNRIGLAATDDELDEVKKLQSEVNNYIQEVNVFLFLLFRLSYELRGSGKKL